MSLDALKQKNIAITAPNSSLEVGGANAESAKINVPIGQGTELGAPVDELKASSNAEQVKITSLRSETEVKNALKNISVQTGLNINELLDIINKMTGKSLSDLQNIQQSEFTNITTGLGKILNSCKVDGKIDSAKLEEAIKNYGIAIQTGWSLDGFFKQQQNVKKSSITERLLDTNCFDKNEIKPFLDEILAGRDINSLTEAEQKEIKNQAIEKYLSKLSNEEYEAVMEVALENFFEKTLLSQINKNTPQAKREQIYKAQLQTYGRLLVNTTKGRDRELLGSAIDKLYRTNIVPAAQAGLQAMETEEAKANFARHIDLKEAVTTASKYEEDVYMTKKEAQELANLKYGHMNAEDIKTDLPIMKQEAEVFFEKNKEILAIIDEKIKNNEELTKEELAIQRERENLHLGRYAGATTGIATSKNSTVVPVKEELLTTVNTDAYEIGQKAGNDFYREVLTQVAEYAESLPEEERANFVALMEKTIGENYTKVTNDIDKGTTTELSAPAPKAEVSVATPIEKTTEIADTGSIDPRYKRSTTNIDALKPHTLTAQLYSPQKQDNITPEPKEDEPVLTSASTMDDYYKAYNGGKGFKKIRDEFGTIAAIKYTFNKQAQDASAMLSAVTTFKGLDCSQQFNTIKGLYSGLTVALDNAKESTMERLQGVTLRTFGATKQAREAAEERLSS